MTRLYSDVTVFLDVTPCRVVIISDSKENKPPFSGQKIKPWAEKSNGIRVEASRWGQQSGGAQSPHDTGPGNTRALCRRCSVANCHSLTRQTWSSGSHGFAPKPFLTSAAHAVNGQLHAPATLLPKAGCSGLSIGLEDPLRPLKIEPKFLDRPACTLALYRPRNGRKPLLLRGTVGQYEMTNLHCERRTHCRVTTARTGDSRTAITRE
jgi:hypothetical protein